MDKLLDTIISAIEDKKGKNILCIDLKEVEGSITDAFVVCNAESTTQVAAIADGIEEMGYAMHRERAEGGVAEYDFMDAVRSRIPFEPGFGIELEQPPYLRQLFRGTVNSGLC